VSAATSTWLPLATLWRREVVRFLREPSRVASAVATPLLFWLLLGSGFSGAFRLPASAGGAGGAAEGGVDFLTYFYPGTVVLVLLFAAIFSTISLIEDRREGFLQGVLAAPVSRLGVAGGKVAGGATLAWVQGAAFLALAPVAGVPLTLGSAVAAAGVLALLAVQLAAVGFVCAWRVSSVQGFHAVMNLLLIPLWLLSGAFFPPSSAPPWLAAVMQANPLTYGLAAFNGTLFAGAAGGGAGMTTAAGLPAPGPSLAVTAVLTAAAFALAWATAGKRSAS
jgi:ABC-2 type transport system permease protein